MADALGQGNTTLSACAGAVCGSTSLTVGPAALVLIAVSPANGTVPSGESLQFSATGTYSDGSSKQLNSGVQWSSADPSVATITAAGVASGVSMGGSNITATAKAEVDYLLSRVARVDKRANLQPQSSAAG